MRTPTSETSIPTAPPAHCCSPHAILGLYDIDAGSCGTVDKKGRACLPRRAGTPSPGSGTSGTRGSYTLRVIAPDFNAENLAMENAFDYAVRATKSESDVTKMRASQGVALLPDMNADRSVFRNERVLGNQDTLFPNAGRSYVYCGADARR
ncbi:MAG: hypothetical protein ABI969_10670 [bacterium]